MSGSGIQLRQEWRLVAVAVLLCWRAYAQPEPISFVSPVHLSTGAHPQTVRICDINHDAKNDILVANSGSGNLCVFLGNGKGGFMPAPGSPFAAGPEPNDLAIADFNGDGHPDVAVANHSTKVVTVLLGNGRGGFSFGPGSPFSVPSNPHPHGIVAADFNGDGKIDLAVDSWGENKVLVLFGNGDGTFQTPGVKFVTGEAPYQRLRAADLNEDGHPDIITSNWRGASVSVLLGDGKGGFSLAGGKNIPVPDSPFGVAVGDFNGDKHLDIAVVHYSGHAEDPSRNGLSILYGDGKGSFTSAAKTPFPVGNYPLTVVAGDLNGDGIADIVIPNYLDNTLTIYVGGKEGVQQAKGSPLRVGRGPHGVAIGDLNGDGKADLVVAEGEQNDILILFAK